MPKKPIRPATGHPVACACDSCLAYEASLRRLPRDTDGCGPTEDDVPATSENPNSLLSRLQEVEEELTAALLNECSTCEGNVRVARTLLRHAIKKLKSDYGARTPLHAVKIKKTT